jgi:putative endonuclease
MCWQVYIILCSDQSLYTGISTDAQRRFQEHKNQKGAKYFRRCYPQQIVYIESGHDRQTASRREVEIKKMKRADKLKLIDAAAT